MADTTYSVKINEELKDKIINAIKSSGVTGKEFFAKLIESYETQNEGHETHVKEFVELEGHLLRIKALYSGLIEDSRLEIEGMISEMHKKLDEKEKAALSLDEKIKSLSESLSKSKAINDELTDERNSLKKTLKELEEKSETNAELMKAYKEKIKKLESEVESYEKVRDEIESLKKQLEEMKSKIEELTREKSELVIKAENTKMDLERIQIDRKKEIENLTIRSKMEHQTEIMKEKQDCQDRMRIIMDDQRKQFEEYNSTIKKLYSQIDDMRDTILSLKTKNVEDNTKNEGAKK